MLKHTKLVPHENWALKMLKIMCVCVCCAPGVFSEGHKSDEARSQTLLVHVSSRWGRTTCLQLALEANDKDFVAHSGVQVQHV